MTRKLVVVGNGMVGQRLVDELLEADADWDVEVIGEEPRLAYDRVALSSYFEGVTEAQLSLVDDRCRGARNVTYTLDRRVDTIDRDDRTVTTDDGATVAYDHLVLATGSAPFVPPIPGADAGRWIRICFANPPPETTQDGIAALAEVCQREFGVPEVSGNVRR